MGKILGHAAGFRKIWDSGQKKEPRLRAALEVQQGGVKWVWRQPPQNPGKPDYALKP